MGVRSRSSVAGLEEGQQTVVFRIGESCYGVDFERVSQIVQAGELGCESVHLREGEVPVVDLRVGSRGDSERVIVLDGRLGKIGVVVDAVTEVTTFTEDNVVEPEFEYRVACEFPVKAVLSHQKKRIFLVDLDLLALEGKIAA